MGLGFEVGLGSGVCMPERGAARRRVWVRYIYKMGFGLGFHVLNVVMLFRDVLNSLG